MSLLQNNPPTYAERLREKLQRMADKRGADSPAAEELKTVAGAPAEAPKGVTEKKKKESE